SRTADKNNTGSKSVCVDADRSCTALSTDGPRSRDCEAGTNHGIEKGFPASAGGARVALALRLLQGVIDRERESWVRVLHETTHGLRHSVEEESVRIFPTAVAVGRCHQLLRLRHLKSGEEIWED